MTADTNAFIRRLAGNVKPVRPLRHPWIRTTAWLAASVPYIAIIVFVLTPRHDLIQKLGETRYIMEQFAALAAAVGAATAAFGSTVPGYNRKFVFLSLVPLSLWLGTLGHGCVQDWLHFGPDGLKIQSDWMCVPAIALMGVVPAITISVMLRRGAPLTPNLTSALGGLAAAGFGSFALRFTESHDAGVMILVWQLGSVLLISALAASGGRYLLNWRSLISPSENVVQ
jgi:hypothetical protein